MSGKKKYEFRKVRCKENVDKIVIYATSPVMQVVGEADVLDVIEDSPETVWEMTCKQAGISKTFYDSYYQGKKKAVAFKLGNITKYEFPLSLSDFGIGFAPQSFMYVKTHI